MCLYLRQISFSLVLGSSLLLSFAFASLAKPGLKNGNKRIKNAHRCTQLQKCQSVTDVHYIVTKVPYISLQKFPTKCCKSALSLQKCPMLRKFPIFVTKVPYFGYKSARAYGSLSLFSLMVSPSNSFSYWSKGLVKVMRMGGVSISRDIISPCDWPMKFLIFTPSSHCTNRLGKVSRVHLPTRPPLPTKFIIVTRDCRWAELKWAKNSITYPNPPPLLFVHKSRSLLLLRSRHSHSYRCRAFPHCRRSEDRGLNNAVIG